MVKTSSAKVGQAPLYRQVSAALLDRIQSGEWPVGTILPRELDLAKQLGVSRVTLRQALGILEKGGVVERVRKVGTKVIAEAMGTTYVQQMDGLEQILRLAGQTAMRVDRMRTVKGEPDEGLAGVASATGYWLAIEGVRHLRGVSTLSTCTTVFVDNKYAGIAPFLDQEVDSVYALVEQVYGLGVHSIRHRISACALSDPMARTLGLPAGSPGLQVQAWLYAADGSLIEYVRSIHNPGLISIEIQSTRGVVQAPVFSTSRGQQT
ncbi:MAG: GntR family transcriptional regulator [Ottowia sp.]|uniref:GntR family transcriptional regulator n=1 Tax=Ottowia sp. TaxID=1898956 RepID=UPI0039E3879D